MNTSQSRVKRTDFYGIIPLSDSYIIILGDTVVGAYTFSSIDEAEEFVLLHYYDLSEQVRRLIPMKKFINFIIFSFLCYLALLIYRGKGVVDFNEVWGEVLGIWLKALEYFRGLVS